jgi:UDP-N-acetylmuramoyl-tripeptide--D-alanyl-D-alanine ligase
MMTVAEAAHLIGADWNGLDAYFTGVSTDSRTVRTGDLFVALSGEKFDGHQFVASAIEKGAIATMVQADAANGQLPSKPLVKVTDTRLGLGQLAASWRKRFNLPLVAVTGSNGKTTVKEMIASILQQEMKHKHSSEISEAEYVLATEGNLNNDIGVPLMLLRLRAQHSFAVIEMGMNHIGEIAYLTQLAKPNVAVITNAGTAHIGGLGTVEAIARAKGEIFAGLEAKGVAVINADDHYAPYWRKLANDKRVIDFGLNKNAQVSAKFQYDSLVTNLTLKFPDGTEHLVLQVPGEHNVRNALAAAAVAMGLGINKHVIAEGLRKFSGVNGRIQKKVGFHHATLLDDSYNANPESVCAALAVLAATSGKKILVLGDMGELGESATDFHRFIGKEARIAGLDRLLTLGELSAYASEEFGIGAQHFKNIDELLKETEKLLAADVTLLVKGSRYMRMERVVERFENNHVN